MYTAENRLEILFFPKNLSNVVDGISNAAPHDVQSGNSDVRRPRESFSCLVPPTILRLTSTSI